MENCCSIGHVLLVRCLGFGAGVCPLSLGTELCGSAVPEFPVPGEVNRSVFGAGGLTAQRTH